MKLERIEIDLRNIKDEQEYEEIEERKIELGSAKDEKYSKEYSSYLRSLNINELEGSRIIDIKKFQEMYDSELNIVNFLENEKITKVKKEIEKLQTKISSLKSKIEKLGINIDFIASNDILIVDDLFNQVNKICNYEKYPAKKYIEDLDRKSVEIINKYKSKISLIEHISFKQLKKYIETRTMFLPDTKKRFIDKELKNTDILLSNIDNKSLDTQQRISVITAEENILVVAGAGSGKTLTKYLVENLNILPKDT